MRRNSPFLLAALAGVFLVGCSGDSSSPSATAPGIRATISGDEGTVRSLIGVVFVDAGLATAANSQFSEVVALKAAGNIAGAQAKALELIKFITKKDNKGRLTTDGEQVADLITAIRFFVGLAPAFVDPLAAGPDGGVGILGPEGGYVYAGPPDNPTGFFKALPASGSTPATFSSPTIVELIPIAPANYPANANPFQSPYPTYPRYFNIKALSSTNGATVALSAPANVGICVITLGTGPGLGVYGAPESIHGSRLHVGHLASTGFDPLVQLGQDPTLPCSPETFGALDRTKPWYAPANVGRSILNTLTPRSANAGHGGTIAQTNSVSPFFVYDFGYAAVGFTPNTLVSNGPGATFQPVDGFGNVITSLTCSAFSSSNPNVGSFDGLFYANAPGTTTISATCASPNSTATQSVSQVVTILTSPAITAVNLSSTSLQIGGPNVPYSATIVNTGSLLSTMGIQGWMVQGNTRRAANGVVLLCPGAAQGELPFGTCTVNWTAGTSNSAAGVGTLVPGPATFVLDLQQGTAQTVVNSKSVPVLLTP